MVVFSFSGISDYNLATEQLNEWDAVTINITRLERCGKGTCIVNDYRFKMGMHSPEFLRCTCGGGFCKIGQNVEILVNASLPEQSVIKACAMQDATMESVLARSLYMVPFILIGATMAFYEWKKMRA